MSPGRLAHRLTDRLAPPPPAHAQTPGHLAWPAVAAAMFAAAWGGNEFTPLLVLYRSSGQFSDIVVAGLLVAGLSLWWFARLLAAGASPLYHLLPGFGLALAFVLARAGIDLRSR